MKWAVSFSVVVGIVFAPLALAQEAQAQVAKRPKIALVLAGGGAKGAAHMGGAASLGRDARPRRYHHRYQHGCLCGWVIRNRNERRGD
ncbi:hypothetical protein VCSRO14_2169 [Vibrio cholerae]|nr:hypothetical protein VCSRO14_2169 [Vibrio cholerae]